VFYRVKADQLFLVVSCNARSRCSVVVNCVALRALRLAGKCAVVTFTFTLGRIDE